jgi:hypothetical protein
MPEDVADVTASGTDRWTVDQAADSLTWTTGEPLLDGEHDQVEFSLRLPDDAGATLVFPVVQRCEEGEAAWTEVADHAEGHDTGHDALERPAPVVVVTPGDPASGADGGTEAAAAATGAEERDPLLVYGAAGVLLAGGVASGAALLRRRRRS